MVEPDSKKKEMEIIFLGWKEVGVFINRNLDPVAKVNRETFAIRNEMSLLTFSETKAASYEH